MLKTLESGPSPQIEICELPPEPFPKDHFSWNAPETICTSQPAENICSALMQDCQSKHGRQGCWAPRNQRELTPLLVEDMTTKTKAFFNQLKNSSRAQTLCCQDNEACKKHFKKTKLKFSQTRLHRDNARYMLAEHEVRVGMNWLVNCRNEECMERMILHELGHSCQSSRPMQRTSFFRTKVDKECSTFLGPSDISVPESCDSDVEVMDAQLKVSAGDAYECVLDGLTNARNEKIKNGEQVCWKSWLHEAEADQIFISYMNDMAHWYTMCQGRPGPNHGPSKVSLNCHFKTPEIRRRHRCN